MLKRLEEVSLVRELLSCPSEPSTHATLRSIAEPMEWLLAKSRERDPDLEERRRRCRSNALAGTDRRLLLFE
jgi:hypothetical protein